MTTSLRQELLKGGSLWHTVNLTGSGVAVEGGWGINTYLALNPTCYLPGYGFIASAFTDYTREQAITHPLFTPFDDARMQETNALNIVDADLRAKMLGDAIPAESFAAGALIPFMVFHSSTTSIRRRWTAIWNSTARTT